MDEAIYKVTGYEFGEKVEYEFRFDSFDLEIKRIDQNEEVTTLAIENSVVEELGQFINERLK